MIAVYKFNQVFNENKFIINSDFILESIQEHFEKYFSPDYLFLSKWYRCFEKEIDIDGNKYNLFINYELYYDEENSEIYNLLINLVELFDSDAEPMNIDYTVLNTDIQNLVTKLNQP